MKSFKDEWKWLKRREEINNEINNIIYKGSQPSLYEYLKMLHEKDGVVLGEELLKDKDVLERLFYVETLPDSMVAPLFKFTNAQVAYRRKKAGILKTGIGSISTEGLVTRVAEKMEEQYGENWRDILEKEIEKSEEEKRLYHKGIELDDKIVDIILEKSDISLSDCLMQAKLDNVPISKGWLGSGSFLNILMFKEEMPNSMIAHLFEITEKELREKQKEAEVVNLNDFEIDEIITMTERMHFEPEDAIALIETLQNASRNIEAFHDDLDTGQISLNADNNPIPKNCFQDKLTVFDVLRMELEDCPHDFIEYELLLYPYEMHYLIEVIEGAIESEIEISDVVINVDILKDIKDRIEGKAEKYKEIIEEYKEYDLDKRLNIINNILY